jgi:hypothetical protein
MFKTWLRTNAGRTECSKVQHLHLACTHTKAQMDSACSNLNQVLHTQVGLDHEDSAKNTLHTRRTPFFTSASPTRRISSTPPMILSNLSLSLFRAISASKRSFSSSRSWANLCRFNSRSAASLSAAAAAAAAVASVQLDQLWLGKIV